METQAFVEIGRKAAARVAHRLNAGNGNAVAPVFITQRIDAVTKGGKDGEINYVKLIELQKYIEESLAPLVEMNEAEIAPALFAISAGAYAWSSENPD